MESTSKPTPSVGGPTGTDGQDGRTGRTGWTGRTDGTDGRTGRSDGTAVGLLVWFSRSERVGSHDVEHTNRPPMGIELRDVYRYDFS